jgi:hypothetical protein
MKKIFTIVVLLAVLALLGWGGMKLYRYYNSPQEKLVFKTEKISRGDLRSTISASGTIEPEELINVEKMEYAHYRDMEQVILEGRTDHPTHFTFGQTLVALGDVLFIPFPYEMFSEIALRLRAYAPYRYVLGLSNANGYEAYLPTEDQLCRGGYEVSCFLYCGAVHNLVYLFELDHLSCLDGLFHTRCSAWLHADDLGLRRHLSDV